MACIELTKLLMYQRGEGSVLERTHISAHLLSNCVSCNQSIDWLQKIESSMATDHSFDFPESVIALAVTRFREWTGTAAATAPIRQFFAKLLFDSFEVSQLADVRSSAGAASSRQMLYRSDGYDIDLRFELSPENNTEQLIGQVLPESWDATELLQFRVQLLQNGTVVSATHTNARGIFTIVPLTSGTYDLRVSVPDGEINLEKVPTARAS